MPTNVFSTQLENGNSFQTHPVKSNMSARNGHNSKVQSTTPVSKNKRWTRHGIVVLYLRRLSFSASPFCMSSTPACVSFSLFNPRLMCSCNAKVRGAQRKRAYFYVIREVRMDIFDIDSTELFYH